MLHNVRPPLLWLCAQELPGDKVLTMLFALFLPEKADPAVALLKHLGASHTPC